MIPNLLPSSLSKVINNRLPPSEQISLPAITEICFCNQFPQPAITSPRARIENWISYYQTKTCQREFREISSGGRIWNHFSNILPPPPPSQHRRKSRQFMKRENAAPAGWKTNELFLKNLIKTKRVPSTLWCRIHKANKGPFRRRGGRETGKVVLPPTPTCSPTIRVGHDERWCCVPLGGDKCVTTHSLLELLR